MTPVAAIMTKRLASFYLIKKTNQFLLSSNQFFSFLLAKYSIIQVPSREDHFYSRSERQNKIKCTRKKHTKLRKSKITYILLFQSILSPIYRIPTILSYSTDEKHRKKKTKCYVYRTNKNNAYKKKRDQSNIYRCILWPMVMAPSSSKLAVNMVASNIKRIKME
jgi:hypothetical protein